MDKNAKIYVAGHRGLVGSALIRRLHEHGYDNLIVRTHQELDLTAEKSVEDFFAAELPEYVFLAAARVGGILANDTYPAEFIHENLKIQTNVIHQAYVRGTKKLLFLGTSCIYPRDSLQPIKEEYLLTGPLEKTNEAYAIAKIAGIKMCEYYNKQYGTTFITVMPTNLYGPNDNFDEEQSHLLPALVRRFTEAVRNNAQTVTLWGTGAPRREPLYVDDMADACLHLMNTYDGSRGMVNIGTGIDYSVQELAEIAAALFGFQGTIEWDTSKPDGTPQKLLDVSLIHALGWSHSIPLEEGLKRTFDWYAENSS